MANDVKTRVREAWNEFKNAVMWVENSNSSEDVSLVEKTYSRFSQCLAESI